MSGARLDAIGRGERPRLAPLVIVTGFGVAAKRRALERWLGERPVNERWAVLADDEFTRGDPGAAIGGAASPPANARGPDWGNAPVVATSAGCACCVGAIALRSALARLQRDGRWNRIFVVLSAPARPTAVIDGLRASIAGSSVQVESVVALVESARPGPWLDRRSPGHVLAIEQAGVATVVIVDRCGDPGPVPPELLAALREGPLGPRPVLEAGCGSIGWPAVAGADAAPDPDAASPVAWRWPAGVVFERRALHAALVAFAQADPLARPIGVFRTGRDWYRWRADRVDDADRWQPTHWRLDSRLKYALTSSDSRVDFERRLIAAIARPD